MDHQPINIFEELAPEYDAWFEKYGPAYESELQAVKRCLPGKGRGLEIGAGTGRFALPLGLKEGVEPAAAMARIAKKGGLEVLRADAGKLPFKAGVYDFVLLVTVLCFLPDPLAALKEAARVLKPSGRIIIGMIDRDSPLGQVYEAKKQESRFYRQARFYPVAQALEWLRSLGYENFTTYQTIFRNYAEITGPEPVKTGHGEGGFAVICADKADF